MLLFNTSILSISNSLGVNVYSLATFFFKSVCHKIAVIINSILVEDHTVVSESSTSTFLSLLSRFLLLSKDAEDSIKGDVSSV